jgi:hypothetical protein
MKQTFACGLNLQLKITPPSKVNHSISPDRNPMGQHFHVHALTMDKNAIQR